MTRVHPEDNNLAGQVDKCARTTVCPLCLQSHYFILSLELITSCFNNCSKR